MPKLDAIMESLSQLAADLKKDKREIDVEILVNASGPAETVIERLREVYAVIKATHEECLHGFAVAEQKYNVLTLPELADILFALKSIGEFAAEVKKRCAALFDSVEKVVCERHASSADNDGTKGIHGVYARVYTRYDEQMKVPRYSKEPERYTAFMRWLGVPEDLIDRGKELYHEGEVSTCVVDLNYNGVQSMITMWKANGYELPSEFAGIEGTYQIPATRICKDEDLL